MSLNFLLKSLKSNIIFISLFKELLEHFQMLVDILTRILKLHNKKLTIKLIKFTLMVALNFEYNQLR